MKLMGILLIIGGIIGIIMGAMMFGDIGIACIVGALAALLSGSLPFFAATEISLISLVNF